MKKRWMELRRRCATVWHTPRGAASAEYALLLALVVIILIGALSQLGQALNTKLNHIITSLNEAR